MPNAQPSDTPAAEDTEAPGIHPWIRLAFEALMSGSGSYGLVPCEVAGEPTAAIVMAQETESSMYIMPLFVALTPSLNLKLPRQRGSSGRSPLREDVKREFAVNVASLART